MAGHVCIVDDDESFRRSLAEIVSSVGFSYDDWGDPEPLLSWSGKDFRRPGCIILDYRLPALSGVEVFKAIRRFSSIPVILISAYADVRMTVAAMQAGITGVFEKPLDDNEFLGFLVKVCFEDRQRIQSQRDCEVVREQLRTLTEPEREVLRLMLEGRPNKVIARELGKSIKAVERNRQNLIRKLGCRTASEALLEVSRCPLMWESPLTCSGVCCFAVSGRMM